MVAQLRSLVWKEWHERKHWLAPGAVWVGLGVGYAVAYESMHWLHAPIASFWTVCMCFGVFAAVFLAMRTALGEATQKTLGFSASMPVSLRQQAWLRLGGAIVTLVAPIVLGAMVMWLVLVTGLLEQAPPRLAGQPADVAVPQRLPLSALAAGNLVWTLAAIAAASSVELLLILCVIGARRRSESHVGFIGACVAFAWLLLQVLPGELGDASFIHWWGIILPQSLDVNYGYSTPEGDYGDLSLAHWVWWPLAANLLVLAALAAWFVRRYGTRSAAVGAREPARLPWQMPALLSRLPIRWPGGWAALVWLDLRQALPMSLAGLVLACLMTAAGVASSVGIDETLPERVAGQLAGGAWIVALLWGAVVGSGIFAGELQPGLGQFWRSRPISPSAWFWVKFVVGLATVLGVLDLVTILVGWGSPYGQGSNRMSLAYVACLPLLHATMYALAVLATCWLRRPVFAAMAALLFYFVVSVVLQSIPGGGLDPIEVYNHLFHQEFYGRDATLDLTRHGYPVVYGAMAAILVGASLAAWRRALRPAAIFGAE